MQDEMFVAVYGARGLDASEIARAMEAAFGASAVAEEHLGTVGDVISFVMKLAGANVERAAQQLVALVRRAVGMRIEIDVGGKKVMIDGASSPEQVMPLLRMVLSDGAQKPA